MMVFKGKIWANTMVTREDFLKKKERKGVYLMGHRGHQADWYTIKWSQAGSTIGKGNGTPLQYSCLENPMDGGAW